MPAASCPRCCNTVNASYNAVATSVLPTMPMIPHIGNYASKSSDVALRMDAVVFPQPHRTPHEARVRSPPDSRGLQKHLTAYCCRQTLLSHITALPAVSGRTTRPGRGGGADRSGHGGIGHLPRQDRKSTRLNSSH